MKATLVRAAELELLDIKVTRDGGAVRYLEGARYGLRTSAYHSEIVPGSGPPEHRHPYAECFVLHHGQGRYVVSGEALDAVAGDMVIVPPNEWHSFANSGTSPLRHTAIHESPVHASEVRTGNADTALD